MADWTKVINEADIGTARLIVQLQMQDAAALAAQPTSEQQPFDAAVARQIFEDELKDLQKLLPDREIGEKITDNENACEAAFESAAFNWKFDEVRNIVEQGPPVKLITCTACTDKIHPDGIVKAPCSHKYCGECVENLFRSSMKDETLYPPRCCKRPIPLNDARKVLSKDLKAEFANRQVEFETKDKTYCAHPRCSTFIKPYTINGNLARCPRCRQATCADCKNQWHYGDCPRDESFEQLLATADENQWRRCAECHRFVELKQGCNHISCRCGHDFCYVCGERWKTCKCPVWHEARLLARGQQIAPNFMPPAPQQHQQNRPAQQNDAHAVAPQQANAPVQQPAEQEAAEGGIADAVLRAMEHVRNNLECQHDSFGTYREPGEFLDCEVCGESFPTWIKQCRQCLMLMCVRCKQNRLRA